MATRLPGRVTTDADTDPDAPPGSLSSQGQQSSRPGPRRSDVRSNSPRTRPRQIDSKKKIAQDIRSVDSGYSETSHFQEAVSPDAVPSHPSSLQSVNLGGSPLSSSVDTISHIQENLVHKIHRAVGGKKDKEESSSMSLPPISSSSSGFSRSSSHSSSLPSEIPDVTDKDIQELLKEMPPDMRVDFQDAMVLYCEDDREKVDTFLSHFDEIMLYDRVKPKVVLYDEIAISIGSKIKALEFGIDRCTYVFLFITKMFCEDSWSEFSSETCLMEAIHTPNKKWCVVPVFTEPKRSASFRVPPSLNSLKGIQYWTNDKFFRDSVQKLLEEKLMIRKKKEKQLTRDRKDWVTKYRIEKMQEEIREEEETLARKKREREARERKEHEMAEMKRRQKEDELKHAHELRKIQSEGNIGIQQMMQQFAQRFGVQKSESDPCVNEPVPDSKSAKESIQCLLQMFAPFLPNSAQGSSQPSFYLPSGQPTSPIQQASYGQFSLGSRNTQGCTTAVQEGQSIQEGYQDVRGPAISDQGSTGFAVPHQARSLSSVPAGRQFHSFPNQQNEVGSQSSEFRSLPQDFRSIQGYAYGDHSETGSGVDPDLDVDYPPGYPSLQTAGPQQGWAQPQPRSTPVKAAQKEIQQLPIGPGGETSSGNGTSLKAACHQPDAQNTAAKEVHYHYHYYGQDKTDKRTNEEQAPINIVGAKIVQIGDKNLVKVLDKGELMEGENTEEMDSSDEEESKHLSTGVPRMKERDASPPSQPPSTVSTIYQDNNPSYPRPVHLPSRQTESNPAESASQKTPVVSSPPGQGQPSIPASVVRPVVASAARPQPSSVGASLPSAPSETPSTLVAPISSGPMASGFPSRQKAHKDLPSVQNFVNPSLHAIPHRQVAMVRPVESQTLQERGATDDNTVQKQVDSSPNENTAPGQGEGIEFEMVPGNMSMKAKEDEDPITEQTLAKEVD